MVPHIRIFRISCRSSVIVVFLSFFVPLKWMVECSGWWCHSTVLHSSSQSELCPHSNLHSLFKWLKLNRLTYKLDLNFVREVWHLTVTCLISMCQLFKLFEIGQFKNGVRKSMGFCHIFYHVTVTVQGACLTFWMIKTEPINLQTWFKLC